jgi:GntR family transcriptional regulator, transcriptional repressor for pyruvate dehydrogenase complex
MLPSSKKTRIYETIVAQLSQLIQVGTLRPGERLPPERELAARLQVSRASVREALRSLELQGLLSSRQGSGTFIAAVSQEELLRAFARLAEEGQTLREIFELRFLLEPPIAALAARRATPQDIARLEATLKAQEQQIHLGQSGVEADIAFHTALAEATHNGTLLRLGATLMEVLAPSRDTHLQTPERSHLSLLSHQRILEAIKAGSATQAHKAMEDHVVHVDRVLFGLAEEAFSLSTELSAGEPFTQGGAYDQTHRD